MGCTRSASGGSRSQAVEGDPPLGVVAEVTEHHGERRPAPQFRRHNRLGWSREEGGQRRHLVGNPGRPGRVLGQDLRCAFAAVQQDPTEHRVDRMRVERQLSDDAEVTAAAA